MSFRITVLLCSMLAGVPVAADSGWEIEADPFAYLVSGYSGHLAYRSTTAYRAQLGVFGADVPRALHSNDDFQVRVNGMTAKFDRYLAGQKRGWFVGIDADYTRFRYRLVPTGETRHRNLVGLGPRVGFRFAFESGFYVTPWVSVRYLFNATDVTLSDRRFDQGRIAVFPTIHLGWRF